MKHSFIDKYSEGDSIIHRLDPRTKLITTLLFLVAVVLTPPGSWVTFVLYLLVVLTILALSGVPAIYVLKRSLVIIPFVLLIAVFIPFFKEGQIAGSYNIWLWQVQVTHNGIQILLNILLKAWLSILSLILLTSTTAIPALLKGLEQLHIPRAMVMILSFMYRYIFLLTDEVMRMKQARDSRSFSNNKKLWQIRNLGNMIGTLFIRSYERGERVYAAMVSRGYDGNSQTLTQSRFKPLDAYFALTSNSIIILIIAYGFFNRSLI